jgi:hypothetical protein
MNVAPKKAKDNQYTKSATGGLGSGVVRTGIGWSEELVAQVQKRLVIRGLGAETFVYY